MQAESAEIVSRIWDESRNRLKSFIARRIDNEADTEDVLQNVFFKIHKSLAELKEPEKLYPWIFRLTRNAITDYYRERKTAGDSSAGLLEELTFEPSEIDVEEEILGWLEPMIKDLPDKYRDALRLTDIQGLTQKELAKKLEISLSGAKSRVQRAREKLRETLLGCCHLEFNRAGRIVEYKPRGERCQSCAH